MVLARAARALDRVRQPEYTGDNRCVPCTVANVVIAIALSGIAGYGVVLTGRDGTLAGLVAVGLFAGSVAAIYLRGYLVPGTPTLTKRYFPDRVLAWFDKAEQTPPRTTTEDIDVETELMDAGVLTERPHGDLGLDEEFATAWRDAIRAERDSDRGRETIASVVGVDPEGLTVEEYDDAFVAYHGNTRIGRWESKAAFLADVAAGRILPDYYDDWDRANPQVRGQLFAGLRLFLQECPACDGPVRFGEETVESCCRTMQVIAVTCESCAARLFEIDATEELLAGETA